MTDIEEYKLMEFLTGEGSDETLAEVKAWLDESPAHVDELLSTERAYLRSQATLTTERQLDESERRLMARLAEEDPETIPPRRRHWWPFAAVARVLLLVAIAFNTLDFHSAPAIELLEAKAPANSTLQLLLSDGTKVWLNEGSTLRYPQVFESDLRKVSLDGEGYFEVAHNAAKPFVVESEAMSVRVLGTKFNFKTSQVSLVEGSVEVRGLHDEGMLVLQPGQRAEIDPATQRLKVSEVDAALEAVWHDDYIPFHNASIAAIAQTLEAVYGMEVVVSDDFDPATTYSGYIRRKESIDSVLTALKNTIPMDYQIRGKAIYIKEI